MERPERRDSGEGLHDVLTLTQQLSNCRLIVPAETRSLYARCLMGSYGRWAEEVGSGEVRSTTTASHCHSLGLDLGHSFRSR